MNKNQFINSEQYLTIFEEIINLKKVSMSILQSNYRLSFKQASILYEEYSLCNNEEALIDYVCLLQKEEEPFTIGRLMSKFDISYPLAKKIFALYMEDI